MEQCDCGDNENNTLLGICNTNRGPPHYSDDAVPQSNMPTKRVVHTTRMGTPFLLKNIFAVLLLAMMIENENYEPKRGVFVNAALLPASKQSAIDASHALCYYNMDDEKKAETNDDDMHSNFDLDLDLDFAEGGHELLKIKSEFDTEEADLASKELERYYDESQDIIVIATVDGTFYGISRSTGQTIWKRQGIDVKKNNSDSSASGAAVKPDDSNHDHRMQVNPSNDKRQPHQTIEEYESIMESKTVDGIFAPLTSTSSTKTSDTNGKSSNRTGRTMAIPSVDGRVFLSSGKNDGNVDSPLRGNGEEEVVNDFFSSSSSDDDASVITTVPDLVDRSPFVDSQGRIYLGSRQSSATEFDRDTGEILRFIRVEGGSINEDDNLTPFGIGKETEKKNVIWVGRIDYSVSVFSSSGDADVEFSTSEVLSFEEMVNQQDAYRHPIYNPALMLSRPIIAATPGGKLAMRDSNSNKILWIADETFDAPVVFALESKYGTSLRVDVIPDAPVHRHFSKEYLSREWKSPMYEQNGGSFVDNKLSETENMFWALTEKEMFTIPFGRRRNYNRLQGLPYMGNELEKGSKAIASVLSDQRCNSLSPLYPACLIRSPRFNKTLTFWIIPIVGLVIILSFEMGRRSRVVKENAKIDVQLEDPDASPLSSRGRIKLSDKILGYGGHGTVVYRGELDGRHVAVKRMLKAYHASAKREISLLIESDGHPHVVRYFLKEARGDFVYLALELCEMTLEKLIVALRQKTQEISLGNGESRKSKSVLCLPGMRRPIKEVLFEVAQGVKHIHSLRIVHRDLKPQNILLAKKARGIDTSTDCISNDNVYNAFQAGEYSSKISDMGLGKQLTGQSSFGLSTLNTSFRIGGGEESLMRDGPGPGTVGWQAREVMVQRPLVELTPVSSDNSTDDGLLSMIEASPIESSLSDRTSRSVDIFSLGCIFHYSLIPGSHPFGEWYERESNIMKNCPSLKALEDLSVDASDLIRQMIDRKPSARPNASQVCNHPFFWTESKRLNFVCDLSDRLEHDALSTNDKARCHQSPYLDALLIEQQAVKIVGTVWGTRLDQGFFNSVTKFRTYDQSSVRDLLRLIRNKHHHFDDLPLEFKEIISNQEGILNYFEPKFPHLFMHCYDICCLYLAKDDSLVMKYDIQSKLQQMNGKILKEEDNVVSRTSEQQQELEKHMIPPLIIDSPNRGLPEISRLHHDAPRSPNVRTTNLSNFNMEDVTLINSIEHRDIVKKVALSNGEAIVPPIKQYFDQDNVIAWEGSTTSSTLGCRGWMRSEDEWIERTDIKWKKMDANLIRGAQDQIFRTRLCNHWDMSQGKFCSLKKKNRCVFAHGPVELRVKEGKRSRWGRLVDKSGNNSNPYHSGGEDTYGAAKSIETERKGEGKWKSRKKGKPKGKETNSSGRKKPNLNKQ